MTRAAPAGFKTPGADSSAALHLQLFSELWTSLASLLRSYTAVHGLSAKREAAIEQTEEKITVRHGEKWLRLTRNPHLGARKWNHGNPGTNQSRNPARR